MKLQPPLLLAFIAMCLTSAAAADRVAFIIGVDEYQSETIPNLDGALRDARLMAQTLEKMHTPFEVILLEDPTLNETLDSLDQFMAKARGAQCAMFFFAGHGIEYHGENFLLTRDSDIGIDAETSVDATKRRLRRKMLSLNVVMDEIELTGSDLKLLILDACRDNPIPAAGSGGKTRSLGSTRGLARVSAPLGMLVSYSADAGQVANDGLFTEILTANLAQPSLSVMEVFAKTREEVNATSRERNEEDARYNIQLPAEYNKLGLKGIKFVFNDPIGSGTTPAPFPANPKSAMPSNTGTRSNTIPSGPFQNSAAMQMVYLPGGTFEMGDLEGTGEPGELPVRKVTVSPFHIAATGTTQAQWQALMGKSIAELRAKAGFSGERPWGIGPDHPVYYVSHHSAVEFCRKLTASAQQKQEIPAGYAYRLPTEAEWEFACRAGSSQSFAGEARDIGEIASYNGAIETGSKPSNGFGLFDMQGNVWEWCQDFYAPYSASETNDPAGPPSGESHVFRGGSWMEEPTAARPSSRGYGLPELQHRSIGFRVVLAPR